MYLCHGYSLVIHDYPFFKEDKIECLSFGAVPIDVYEHFIDFNEFDNVGNIIVPKRHATNYLENTLSKNELEIMNIVLEFYGQLDGWISNVIANDFTSPWYTIVSKKGFHDIVPDAMTKKYFKIIVKIMLGKEVLEKKNKSTAYRNRDVTLH